MKIILAAHLGMCFGVRDAIAQAKQLAARAPLTVLGELVHNPIVREALRLLEEQEQERRAKLAALRQAAKQVLDEIDQGKGVILKGKKGINQFITEIETEVRTKAAISGG